MKEDELFIGSYVKCNRLDKHKIYKVISIDKGLITLTDDYYEEIYVLPGDISPMELNKEYLIHRGFSYRDSSFCIDIISNSSEPISLEITHNEMDMYYVYLIQGTDIIQLRSNLRYIHQLQNIMNSITK